MIPLLRPLLPLQLLFQPRLLLQPPTQAILPLLPLLTAHHIRMRPTRLSPTELLRMERAAAMRLRLLMRLMDILRRTQPGSRTGEVIIRLRRADTAATARRRLPLVRTATRLRRMAILLMVHTRPTPVFRHRRPRSSNLRT